MDTHPTTITNEFIAASLLREAQDIIDKPGPVTDQDDRRARALRRGALLIKAHPAQCADIGGAPDLPGIGKGIKRRVAAMLAQAPVAQPSADALAARLVNAVACGALTTPQECAAAADLLRHYAPRAPADMRAAVEGAICACVVRYAALVGGQAVGA